MLRIRHLSFCFSLGLLCFTQYFGLPSHWITSAVCIQKHLVSRRRQSIWNRFIDSVFPLQGWRIRMRCSALVLSLLRHSERSHLEHWRTVCNSCLFRGFRLHFPKCSDLQTIKALAISCFFFFFQTIFVHSLWTEYTCIGQHVVLILDSLSCIWTCFCLLKLKCRGKKVRFAERKRSPVNIRWFKTLYKLWMQEAVKPPIKN